MWLKANPNLGNTVSYEAYQNDVERAENAPSTRNDILAKRFGILNEGSHIFLHLRRDPPASPAKFCWNALRGWCRPILWVDDFSSVLFLIPTWRRSVWCEI